MTRPSQPPALSPPSPPAFPAPAPDTDDALDMRDAGDRRRLAEAIRRGWSVDPDRKARYLAALDALVREAPEMEARDRASIVIGANRIYQLEQAAALKDLHQLEHDARVDAGRATERVAICPTIVVRGIRPDPGEASRDRIGDPAADRGETRPRPRPIELEARRA